MYRFFGSPGEGPSSHFFTRDRAECYAVDKSAQWDFEGLPFCGDGAATPMEPVPRRLRSSACRSTASGARSATPTIASRPTARSSREMVAQGWVDEGAAMCVLPPA